MKKINLLLVIGIISCWVSMIFAQTPVTIIENFDGNKNTFTSTPASAWKIDANYSVNSPNSILGEVPNKMGDSIVLTSPIYDFYAMKCPYVLLKFSHICKVSPMDIVRVEYKRKGEGWQPIPAAAYNGKAKINQLGEYIFNANTYSEWRVEDSIGLPSQSWWKEELFDVSIEVGNDDAAQFRFVLKHGDVPGTQISYGWLIDNIEVIAAPYEVKMPVVEFVTPLVKGSVYSTGSWEINAKVKTQTTALIENPWLVYTVTNDQGVVKDSILMTSVKGDSLWKAAIPQFILGTEIVYSITGKDTTGNMATITSGYVIEKPDHNYGDTSAVLTAITSPIQGQTMGNTITPVEVILYNRGDSALTSASIHWSVNRVERQPYSWNGNLSWDFEQHVTIGTYQPTMEGYDTIVIWIETINGIPNTDLTWEKSVITYGCSANMSGQYTVGTGGNFPTLADALTVLGVCSPIGDITLALTNGIYAENWDLTNISNFMGNHTLTITSLANDKDSVILRPTTGIGIVLNNSNDLKIEHITVNSIGGNYAIQFTGACSNVVIRNCNLMLDSTATTSGKYIIYKASGTGIANNISITHNIINGGYYGIYFFAGTGSTVYGYNISIDSNTIKNQYYYGMYIYYAGSVNFSVNTITNRKEYNSSYFYGMYLLYCNGTVRNNRIHQKSVAITYTYGINIQYFNYYNTSDTGLIANNEIILKTTSTYSGIYANTYTRAKILHNSIYVSGTGAARGIQIVNNANNYMVVKNNNIVMEATGAFPIYLNAVTNVALYDMDYNNMSAGSYVGYAGGNKNDIQTWQTAVPSDHNSVNIRPDFIDSTVNLNIMDYVPLRTLMLPEVDKDIEDIYRLGTFTAMGCYHGYQPYAINVTLRNISGFRTGGVFGQQDTIKIQLFNIGTSALTTATLKWSVNGNPQSTTGITWSGTLLPGQNVIVTLGTINYTQGGDNTIKVWIDNLGALQDEYSKDDTATVLGYICPSALNGTYTIGNGGDFSSWDAVVEMAAFCGVGGDVVLKFLPGTYLTPIDLSGKSTLFGNHQLTITSSNSKASEVMIKIPDGYGILLNNSNNIVIDAITIDAAAATYAIQFTGACTNVVIQNCILLSDSTTTSNKYTIYKATATGVASNISIMHNTINGGAYGISLYAGTGTNLYGNHITIDSNILTNQLGSAISIRYADSVSISHNTVTSRKNDISANWYGVYVQYYNGHITNNRILQRSNAITNPYGIYTNYFNYYNTIDTGIIANNEIILHTTGLFFGIDAVAYTKAKILHNSIYISGIDAARGIYLAGDAYSFIMLKNNNIVMASPQAHPIYLNSIANLQNYDIDYNNMYAPTYVGYAEDNIGSIEQWRQIIATDKNSVSINPLFIDNSVDLQLSDYRGLECYPLIEMAVDIEQKSRTSVTAMGCYQGFTLYDTNAMLMNIHGHQSGYVLGITDTLKVVLVNMGNTPLTSATLNWSFNGVTQSTLGVNWSGSLALGEKDTIILGVLTYSSVGYYTIDAWISGLGSLQDQYIRNDTAKVSGYICTSPNGIITIGTTGTFTSIKEALNKLYLCGINGDITFALQPGTYQEEVDLKDISLLLGNNKFMLTSTTKDARDVVIKSKANGIVLANSNNIIIDAITIDITEGVNGIYFTDACTNVIIRDCRILADTTITSSQYGITYKNNIIYDSIFIINNYIEGGYTGIYFNNGKNMIIDSNIITNQYYIGMNFSYCDIISLSKNTVLSRTSSTYYSWWALYLANCNGDITANKIRQRSENITSGIGIHLYYYNYNTSKRGLVSNNEIILRKTSGTNLCEGISTYFYCHVDILHNSIYISGTGSAYGIYMYEGDRLRGSIKHNNIVMESPNAYAVYITDGITTLGRWDIDENNYYASSIGSIGGNTFSSLSAWKSVVFSDKNSVSVCPKFIDSTSHLQLINYDSIRCIPFSMVTTDIIDSSRTGITAMGCYHGFNQVTNAMLTAGTDWTTRLITGNTDTMKVELTNTAPTPLTSATIYWSFNGNTVQSIPWSGYLARGQKTTISLGQVTYISEDNTFVAWIQNLGSLQDEYLVDDTVKLSAFACDSLMNGTYIIGATGHYTTIAQALEKIEICGVSGNIILKIQPGIYLESVNLTDISLFLGRHNLTLTSTTGNAEDVVIQTTGSGIILNNSNNITIQALTVDAISGMYGIFFSGPTDNIVIRNCRIFSDSTTTSTIPTPIYKAGNSGTANNTYIINNTIYGGYRGIYFYGGSDTNTYSMQVVIDSNTIQAANQNGVYAYYTDFKSISYNNITNTNTDGFLGINLLYINGNITGNRICIQTQAAQNGWPDGISVSYHNVYNTVLAGLIDNNEIRLNTNVAMYAVLLLPCGITVSSSHSSIVHNSINISGTGAALGITINSFLANKKITIRNNIIKIEGVSSRAMLGGQHRPVYSYALYFSGQYPSQSDIDYNNLVAGCKGGTAFYSNLNMSLLAWQQASGFDLHSISIAPDFTAPTVNLELNDFTPMLCPRYSDVTNDIQGIRRGSTTVMGAYAGMKTDYDLVLQNITRMEDEVVNNQTAYVGIEVANTGDINVIDSAIFRWSIDGIIQPKSYKWVPSSPLQFGQGGEIFIDSFTVSSAGYTEVIVWVEKVNEGRDSIVWNDTVSKTASIVPLVRFASPEVADTINALSFDVYVKIMEQTGALSVDPTPKMNIQTQMTNGTVLYDTIDMIYNNSSGLWVAHVPQQYYGSIVIYSVTVSDTKGNNNITIRDQTYLKFVSGSEAYPGSHIAVTALQGLVESGCIPDYVTATITLSNVGTTDYDFAGNPVKLYMQVTQPVPFYLDTVISTEILEVGSDLAIEVSNMFPTVVAGVYDIRVWIDSISPIVYDDTLALDYTSGKFGLPIDDDFSNGISIVFKSEGNTYDIWESVTQGTGADTVVKSQFGTGMLAFGGSPGSMTTLITQQLDLSLTVQPSLTFWYFHDTIPCEDYTDVRITVDGGNNYMTLFSLTKYDAVYGWRQYSMDLPPYAVNQCVIIVFEAMEKSRSGNVTQYIDRIRITARQDIKLEDIFISEYTVCDLEDKELKVVLSNISDIALDYAASPTTITLEVKETGQTFTKTLTSDILGSFASDTIAMTTDFDLAKGTYTFKAYFFTALDVDRQNDTLEKSISINPRMSVRIHSESTPNSCLAGELVIYPTVTVYNMGNMPLSDIDLVFQIDTGANFDIYTVLEETCTQTILAGDTLVYHFTNSYTVPWKTDYYSRITASLSCDAALIDTVNETQECVDVKDLYMVSIDNPSASVDRIGSAVQVQATLGNRDDLNYYTGLNITVVVTNSQGVQMDKFTEMTGRIDMSSTASHSFNRSYTVPNDSVYYLTVYLDHYDNYLQNDTTTIRRETTDVRIASIEANNAFTLGQNIPNPATNSTRIDYSVPEAGEVIFHVHSISGQLLYSQTIEAIRGTNSIELNTSTFAAGVYFYSMEYKGQRLVRQLIINN